MATTNFTNLQEMLTQFENKVVKGLHPTKQEVASTYATKDSIKVLEDLDSSGFVKYNPSTNRFETIEIDYVSPTQVEAKIKAVVGAAPAALDTLKEISDALGNDANLAGTLTTRITNVQSALNTEITNVQTSLNSRITEVEQLIDNLDSTYGEFIEDLTSLETKVNQHTTALANKADKSTVTSLSSSVTSITNNYVPKADLTVDFDQILNLCK
jgi:hypothetical protein